MNDPQQRASWSCGCFAVMLLAGAMFVACLGCDVPALGDLASGDLQPRAPATRQVPLSKIRPPAEVAVAARHKNIGSYRQGWGSCYHAACCDGLAALGRGDIAARWYAEHRGGATCFDVCAVARGYGLKCTCRADYDPQILQAASDKRLGAAISFPDLDAAGQPVGRGMHAVWFAGYVGTGERQFAAVLDNNFPGRYCWFEKQAFLSWWQGFGSQSVVFDLPAPPVHPLANHFPFQ